MPEGRIQIGEVAERTGLSVRTIRFYEESGLVEPSARSQGGFRLYTDDDVARLHTIRRLKPLEFSLEEIRDVLSLLDRLADRLSPRAAGQDCTELLARLAMYRELADQRVAALYAAWSTAVEFATHLRRQSEIYQFLPGVRR